MPKIAGGKISQSHCTAIDAAEPVVKAAEKCPFVTKISLGVIDSHCGGSRGSRRIKIVDTPTGLTVKVRGNTSAQEIHIWTKDRHATSSAIDQAFNT